MTLRARFGALLAVLISGAVLLLWQAPGASAHASQIGRAHV